MKKLVIEIEMENDAFHTDANQEVWRILTEFTGLVRAAAPFRQITPGILKGLYDFNGNSVGEARLEEV